jgi:3-hydroxybutyryl-CoA dehydratase
MLTASHISAALVNFAGPGWLYVNQSLYFRAPVRIGDTVTTQVKVEKCLMLKHLVELSTESRVADKIVLTGTATIKSPD